MSSGGGAGGDQEVGGSSQPHLPSLLPPLLPTADCPPKGKEEHQQTETLPVMDKNTLHHTHQIQRVRVVNPPNSLQCLRITTAVDKDPCAQMAAFRVCSGKAV